MTELDIEKMMTRLVAETNQLLSKHHELLTTLGVRLSDSGSLTATDVAGIMAKHGVSADVRPEGFQWLPDYRRRLNQA